jgi:hypothetical protein
MQKWDSAPLILTAAFVLLILVLNVQLFTHPIVEFSDYAANSLLVQQAKHFTLLTGHYSRWGFHHPGPFFLYLFALGEFVFYDALHVVPAPYNAQLLVTIIFNGILLYAALCVFRRHAKLSVPMALLVITVVTITVNASIHSASGALSIMISNWMPDVLFFPYLLFAVSAASVMAGRTRDLPLLAFAGMILIHAHFAQFLFVGVIGGSAVVYIVVRAQRQGGLRTFLSEARRSFAVAAAIVFVLALPPLLEIVLDRPNNLDAVLAYNRQFGYIRNNLFTAIDHFACFLLFVPAPETAIPKGLAGIMAMSLSRPEVVAYWLLFVLFFLFAVVAPLSTAKADRRAPFLGYLALVTAASVLLFVYWGTRITGGFYAFNGAFAYSFHLLLWFLLLAEVGRYLSRRVIRAFNVSALVLLLVLGIVERKALRNPFNGDPDALPAAMAMPAAPFGALAITFDHDEWADAIGMANSMKRLGKPFCVNSEWAIIFSRDNVCPDLVTADKLRVARVAAPCMPPCRPVYRGEAYSVTRYPHQTFTLPLDVDLHESPGVERAGFNADEGTHRWLQKHAAIRFALAPELPTAPCFRLALTGYDFPGRPAELGVNGRTLGTLAKIELNTALFTVPREALRPGQVNSITLDSENAGPVGEDRRDIGFAFLDLVLRPAAPDESCAVDPSAHPPK